MKYFIRGKFTAEVLKANSESRPPAEHEARRRFKGGTDMTLAAHRREIDGGCFTYESTRHAFPGELKSGEIRIIAQVSENRGPDLRASPWR